jgi:hypothetical protein
MQRYAGFREHGYRFEVKVPASIFEERYAVISAYQGTKCVDREFFPLREMPTWDVPAQAVVLTKSDEKTLEQKTRELMKRLPNLLE